MTSTDLETPDPAAEPVPERRRSFLARLDPARRWVRDSGARVARSPALASARRWMGGVARRAGLDSAAGRIRSAAGPRLRSAGSRFDRVRGSRRGRIALWSLVLLMAAVGSGLIAYPVGTNIWTSRIQSKLKKDFSGFQGVQAGQQYRLRQVKVGGALTRLIIPRLKLDVIVVEGITTSALRAGVGHYPDTALPGMPGNSAIAGHRTGYQGYFLHLDQMRPGDEVTVITPLGRYIYQVVPPFEGHGNPWTVDPHDGGVIAPTLKPSLTLTTCDPPRIATKRLIVRAQLVAHQPPAA